MHSLCFSSLFDLKNLLFKIYTVQTCKNVHTLLVGIYILYRETSKKKLQKCFCYNVHYPLWCLTISHDLAMYFVKLTLLGLNDGLFWLNVYMTCMLGQLKSVWCQIMWVIILYKVLLQNFVFSWVFIHEGLSSMGERLISVFSRDWIGWLYSCD